MISHKLLLLAVWPYHVCARIPLFLRGDILLNNSNVIFSDSPSLFFPSENYSSLPKNAVQWPHHHIFKVLYLHSQLLLMNWCNCWFLSTMPEMFLLFTCLQSSKHLLFSDLHLDFILANTVHCLLHYRHCFECSTWHNLMRFIILSPLFRWYCYSYFTDEKTEALRDEIGLPKSQTL